MNDEVAFDDWLNAAFTRITERNRKLAREVALPVPARKSRSIEADFERWLETMRARLRNVVLSHRWPVYATHGATKRKVWFHENGDFTVFQLDDAGRVIGSHPSMPQKSDIEKERNDVANSMSRKDVIKSQLRELQRELAHLNRFPEDDFADGTVLQVVKTYKRPLAQMSATGRMVFDPKSSIVEERRYTYVLLKANGAWWCTGENGHQINGTPWEKVIEFVGDDELFDVRTGLSVMTDAGVTVAEGWVAIDANQTQAPTLVDVLGEERAAQVEKFLANPETGVNVTRPMRKVKDGAAEADQKDGA